MRKDKQEWEPVVALGLGEERLGCRRTADNHSICQSSSHTGTGLWQIAPHTNRFPCTVQPHAHTKLTKLVGSLGCLRFVDG